jgi:hypothetical protein
MARCGWCSTKIPADAPPDKPTRHQTRGGSICNGHAGWLSRATDSHQDRGAWLGRR